MDKQEYIKKKYLATAPGDAETKDYIARKYLAGGSDDKKKKKKVKSSSSFPSKLRKGNIGIVDEDDLGWKQVKAPDEEDEDAKETIVPVFTEGRSSFKGTTDGWITIREGDAPRPQAIDPMDVEDEDERPVIVGEIPTMSPPPQRRRSRTPSSPSKRQYTLSPPLKTKHDAPRNTRSSSPSRDTRSSDGPRMTSGARVGLQTYAETKAETELLRAEHNARMRALDPEQSGRDAETVYRDASGRKVDMALKKAEEKRAKQEEIERQEKMMEWGKGLVQRKDKEEQVRKEMEERAKPLARYVDDEELNDELRNKQLWNDPAAAFLTQKSKSKGPKKPTYKGPWPPNRFGIPPGYRWDGVDRSNGFEREFFSRQNTRAARAAEAYAWGSEDM
ncbi:Pre-mRNA-splicing factor CWC26 [Jimgerdemannia flammicorona]|uniref:Pre-mRNA-splicing factor CWC26 n=2 Tax=Jimgerdemannia flammicorona TaxID=994334 RepID=A0A433DFZ6_9FUNG|nr:Pre-mRNA-splicing factor CWC26 [Jimgerdemannia flammicorona]RUS19446.1 Pre-mRNA-splicing factor CWC26 [Jimgerdemannia flammicorona]